MLIKKTVQDAPAVPKSKARRVFDVAYTVLHFATGPPFWRVNGAQSSRSIVAGTPQTNSDLCKR